MARDLGLTRSEAVNLDDERYADPESIYQYVLRGLERETRVALRLRSRSDRVAAVAPPSPTRPGTPSSWR